MDNKVIIAGAALVVGAVLGYAWLAPVALPPPTEKDAQGESEALHAVERLNADVQRLSGEIAELQSIPETAAAAADRESVPPPIAATAMLEEDAASGPEQPDTAQGNSAAPTFGVEQQERITAALETRLASEEPDSRWASGAESQLADGLQNAGLENTALVAVACRSTLCKLSVNHGDTEAEDAFLGRIADLPGMQDTEIFYVRDEAADGSTQMVLYVGRQGYDLGL